MEREAYKSLGKLNSLLTSLAKIPSKKARTIGEMRLPFKISIVVKGPPILHGFEFSHADESHIGGI
jgi:hypothetical protein